MTEKLHGEYLRPCGSFLSTTYTHPGHQIQLCSFLKPNSDVCRTKGWKGVRL